MPPIWKRTIDIVGAMAGLLLASPIMALTAAFIKLVSPGPVMYRQSRVGIGRREFVFFKFRTMHVATTDSSHADYVRQLIAGNQTMEKLDEKDPRIIRGGSVIRKTCIDELPQLYNILRGDMSLVGPRPCIPYEADEYLRWHAERFSVLPGLTGLWQVSGKNRLTFEQMIRLDITYQNRMSPWLDLWIILLTIPTVLGLVLDAVHRKLGSVGSTATVTTDTVVHLSSRQG
ncbi:MAG: sugar transferase [Rhodothermales bacterium]